jgi:hypothetical protein
MNLDSRTRTLALAIALAAVAFLALGLEASAQDADLDVPNFEDVATERGVDFECQAWDKEIGIQPRFFTDAFFCPTPAVADVNGDGHLDLFFPNQRYAHQQLNERQDPTNQLYLNQGDGTFRDVTDTMGWDDDAYSMAAAPIDHDGDGDLDLYVANFASDNPLMPSPATTFLENNGDGTWTQTQPEGLQTDRVRGHEDNMFGSAVAVADYDRDGDMDIYRGNYAKYLLSDAMPDDLQQTIPESNKLYENQGDGTFEDVTIETQASVQTGRTFAVNFVDVNEDGWPDLYVANDENPNELYINRPDDDGGRTFAFASPTSGAADGRGAMCSEAADFDNDGHLDLYMTHYEDEGNGYYLGNGDGTFENAGDLGDLPQSYHMLGWGCPAVDLENDGDRDLFVANGHMTPTGGEFFHDDPADDNGYALPNQLYLNTLQETGEHSWAEVSEQAGPAFDTRRTTSGAQAADLDRDGAQEIIAVNNNNEQPAYLDADPSEDGNWLSVDLRSPDGNRFAIGAHVEVTTDDLTLTDQRKTGDSLASGSVLPLHFGLGEETGPAQVTVDWPDGTTSTHTVDVNQHVRLVQDEGVQHDTTAPRADVSYEGEAGEGHWFTSGQVTVTLDAHDDGGDASGVDQVRYRVDEGPIQAYEDPFTITEPGEHQLFVYTGDQAGNEAWFPYTIGIDTTSPDAEITDPDNGTITVQETTLTTEGEDTWMAPPTAVREHPAEYADGVTAGYASEAARLTGIGAPYPASLEEALAGSAGSDGRTTVQASAADATSGPAKALFHLDGEAKHTDDEQPFAWDADLRGLETGNHTIRVVVHDGAGLTDADERTVTVVSSSQESARASAEDPPEADEVDPGPEDIPRGGVDEVLAPIPEQPVQTAEPDDGRHWYNGAGSYLFANERDAPIWRQVNFISDDEGGTVGQYVVLNPDTFLTSPEPSNIYQFPDCESLAPVLDPPKRQPLPEGGETVDWDRPMRQIVNVQLSTGCDTQPESVDEVLELAETTTETELWVNAPKIPERIDDWPDEELFNAPPYRPRISAFQDGDPVEFITYEASWVEPWVGTKMPGDQDVFIVSTTPTIRPDFTLLNVNVGAPNHPSFMDYSPVWRANCVVAEDNKKCMIAVNKQAGFEQCRTVSECLNMENDNGVGTEIVSPNTFTHINCPYVAVDTSGDDFVDPHEEFYFPNLWVDGPVIVN